ncbi:PREDICTED: vegetative cell wall protein gp1-like [Rhinopithecus bieti]|uniref:vegetative cell wall protein gp1-like n=1 Tax=Rhinopithecus bieti TaxID=61621 RepID=UPI00083C0A6E|nr:PREDICTED: vegetative cell wall protein gp1-like [Rhinopithecus bieti]
MTPSCFPALHIWFRFLSPGEVKVEGRAPPAVSSPCPASCTPPAPMGAGAGAALPPAWVTRRPALLPSRPRPPARRLLCPPAPSIATSPSARPLPQPELPVTQHASLRTRSGPCARCLPQGESCFLQDSSLVWK